MIDFQQFYSDRGCVCKRTLSRKNDSAVYHMQDSDGSSFILRIYRYELSAYRELEGHTCVNLPQIYRTYIQDGLFFTEEEYIDGISLQEMIAGGARMDETRTRNITAEICNAAAYLHTEGFIHRDIKPEHVLITPEYRVVLIDLDAAMRIQQEKTNDTQLLGTAMYAAPEQFGLSRSDGRTDIYAVGILMNELLTGVHPAVIRYRQGPLERVIDRCTQMNPADRYQSAAELIAALDDADAASVSDAFVGPFSGAKQPVQRRQSWFGKFAAGISVCLLAVILFWSLPDPAAYSQQPSDEKIQQENRQDEAEPPMKEADSLEEQDKPSETEDFEEKPVTTNPAESHKPSEESKPPVRQTAVKNPETQEEPKASAPDTSEPEEDHAARVKGTEYLQLYKEGQRETVYINFRRGSQSAKLFTEDGILVDETWNVYADKEVGIILSWHDYYEGWTLRSENCDMGAVGYLHAEKDGKHYAIQVLVVGEPMSAYSKLPELGDYTDGYIQPKVYPEIHRSEIIKLSYKRDEPVQLYLVAMDGFHNLQPQCRSELVTITPCADALAWHEPVFSMVFDNPDGGDVMFEIISNHTNLIFCFAEE